MKHMLNKSKLDKKLAKTWKKPVRDFYFSVIQDYGLQDDATALEILTGACNALQLVKKCEAIIEKEGMSTRSRFGEIKAHPLLCTARDAHQLFLKSLKSLNLEIGEPTDVGRPPGSSRV